MDIRFFCVVILAGGFFFVGCEYAELIGPSVDPSESYLPTLTQV